MTDKLLIVLVNADPNNALELSAPLTQAMTAAAMEFEVEVIFSGRAGLLAKTGVAEKVIENALKSRTIHDVIKEAHDAGVCFKVCTPTLDLWGDDLIPEIDETVGGAYLISEAMDSDTTTFTY